MPRTGRRISVRRLPTSEPSRRSSFRSELLTKLSASPVPNCFPSPPAPTAARATRTSPNGSLATSSSASTSAPGYRSSTTTIWKWTTPRSKPQGTCSATARTIHSYTSLIPSTRTANFFPFLLLLISPPSPILYNPNGFSAVGSLPPILSPPGFALSFLLSSSSPSSFFPP